jgi:hypothetical protein
LTPQIKYISFVLSIVANLTQENGSERSYTQIGLGVNPTLSAIFFNGKKNKGLGAERNFSTKIFYGI